MLWSKAAPLVPAAYEAQVREKIKSGMGAAGCLAAVPSRGNEVHNENTL